jgi:hypothetical protein
MLFHTSRIGRSRISGLLCGVGIALSGFVLSGCAAGDVEMNGALFDYLGMGKSGATKVSQAPERQGLVVPPSLDRLPEPGSGAAATAQVALPVNPETKMATNAAEQKRQQGAYCDKALAKAKLMKEEGAVQGPFGPCNPSVFEALNGSNPLQNVGGTQTVSLPKR